MHLQQLELNGFKSFANRTRLEFPQGLTAVVGPNGTGKSNIVDAIRWAMGEQSMKRVRSSEGADLIFSGSEGAARKGKASVRMVFDNSDQRLPVEMADVEIERAVSRDGSSTFRINRDDVRLTDIVELLAHGNVGHRSTAVINQGMEAEILRAGPTQLRDMMEESSGVKPLQMKRRRAERRLRATRRNRKEAQSLLRELRPHLKFLKSQMERVSERQELEEEVTALVHGLQHYKTNELVNELKELESTLNDLDEELATKEEEHKKLEAEEKKEQRPEDNPTDALRKQRSDLEEKRRMMERRRAELAARLEMQSGTPDAPSARSVETYHTFLEDQLTALQSIVAADDFAAQRSALRSLVEDTQSFLEQEHNDTEDDASDDMAEELASLTKDLEELAEKIASLEQKENEVLEEWRGTFVKRAKALRSLEGSIRDLKERRRDASWKQGKLQELERRIDAALGDVSNLLEQDVDEVQSVEGQEEARSALERIQFLQQKMEALEEGDDDIIEEYKDVMERVQQFEQQIADLDETVQSLQQVVAELERKMKNRFEENLGVINDGFHHYFRMLFGGGAAKLRPVTTASNEEVEEEDDNEHDEIEGLEIHAKLPGKRIDDLHSFSGGEKALTSIALLFAIIAANPPPFLVLDEVDATLDESNAQRFCKILRELQDKTQFILITHNRETMREADLLYGVTMGGDGISQVLSLKLEKAQEYAQA